MPRETQAQRAARLEAENLRLQEELRATRDALEAVPPRRRGGAGRALASAALIVIGALLAPVALVAGTSQRLLTDSDYFVDTLAPLVNEEAVQRLIIAETTDAIRTRAGLDALVSRAFDGLDGLGLPSRAVDALRLLEGPAAEGVGAVVERAVTRVVTSEHFTEIIRESLRLTHGQLVAALSGNSSTVTIGADGTVGVALGPIVDRVRTMLSDAGFPLARLIPSTDAVIVVAQSAELAQLAWVYRVAVAVGPWLQWVVVILWVGAVLVARRRSPAFIGVGIALALAAGALGAAIASGRVLSLGATSGTLPADAVGVVYDSLTEAISASVVAAVVVGLSLALVAWLAGPSRTSVALRRVVDDAADGIRVAAERRGLGTGRVGELLRRGRLALRVAVALVAAVIVLFVRPLTPATVIWTLVIALLVIVIARVLERPVAAEGAAPDPAKNVVTPQNG